MNTNPTRNKTTPACNRQLSGAGGRGGAGDWHGAARGSERGVVKGERLL